MKFLIAVDGSKYSEEAARSMSCFPLDSEILLVHAIDPSRLYPVLAGEVPVLVGYPSEESLRLQGQEILNRASRTLGEIGFQATKKLEVGFPADVILSIAEAEKVDLIVMGARGLGPVEELVFGSVSHQVLGHASCPVLVVRHGISRATRVLVPAETGQDVRILQDFVARKPFREAPELEFVAVLPTHRGLYDDAERGKREYQRAAESVEELTRRARALGYRANGEVVWGSPNEAVLHEAGRYRADLIVIGSRGRSAWSRWLLGSAGHAILHRAQCPVLVVRERPHTKVPTLVGKEGKASAPAAGAPTV